MIEFKSFCLNTLRGKHSLGQILNSLKYFIGNKNKQVLNWGPVSITAFLTYKCNLSCDMCLTHSTKKANLFGQKPVKDLNYSLFKEIVDTYKNALMVSLIGNGEPLLNKDIFKMIEYATIVRKMYTFSVSNGVLVGDYIKEIVDSQLTEFCISVNGHNAEEFKRMTGMSELLFPRICENTRKLVDQRDRSKSKLKIFASIILDSKNYRQLEEMLDFAESLEVDGVYFFQFLPSVEEGFRPEERCIFTDDQEAINFFNRVRLSNKKRRIQIILPTLLSRNAEGKYCSTPFFNLSVDGEGRVGGCSCQLLDLSGNERFNRENVWNNKYFQDIRRRLRDQSYPLLQPCTWCFNNMSYDNDIK